MKVIVSILCLLMGVTQLFAASSVYQSYSGATISFDLAEVFERNKNLFTSIMPRRAGTERSFPAPATLLEQLNNGAHRKRILSVQSPAGRMRLPDILVGGFEDGMDNSFLIDRLAANDQDIVPMLQYVLAWSLFVNSYPDQALTSMLEESQNGSINSLDVLRLVGVLATPPGSRLAISPKKDIWQRVHNSNNSVHRIIALEKFDSVEQSPAEMLALYRECLFGACSYLEVRALEAITRNKDFREEVAKILEEYIASNPPANDGTLPGLRNNFASLIEGAKDLIVVIRSNGKPKDSTPPQPDQLKSSGVQVRPQPSESKPVRSSEEPSSSLWLIWTVIIIAAIGLPWLLLKRRK